MLNSFEKRGIAAMTLIALAWACVAQAGQGGYARVDNIGQYRGAPDGIFAAGHPQVGLRETKGRGHGGVEAPSHPLLLEFVRGVLGGEDTASEGP